MKTFTRKVTLWMVLVIGALATHVGIELLIRGSVRWDLVVGSSAAVATAVVLASGALSRTSQAR